jgi:hypothetical protein
MARTTADRQREFRKRVNAAAMAALEAELAAALGRESQMAAAVSGLEAELEQARSAPAPARCRECGTALACPQCHGAGEYA